jgi:hypothetical protein
MPKDPWSGHAPDDKWWAQDSDQADELVLAAKFHPLYWHNTRLGEFFEGAKDGGR